MSALRGVFARRLPGRGSFALKAGLVTAGVAAFTILLGIAFSYVTTRDHIIETTERDLLGRVQRSSTRFETLLLHLVSDLEGAAGNTLLTNALADSLGRDSYLRPYLNDIKKIADIMVRVALCDFRGRTIAANRVEALAPLGPEFARSVIDSGLPKGLFHALGKDAALSLVWPVVYPNTGLPEGALVYQCSLAGALDSLALPDQCRVRLKGRPGDPDLALRGEAPPAGAVVRSVEATLPALLKGSAITFEMWQDPEDLNRDMRSLALRLSALAALAIAVVTPLSLLVSHKLLSRLRGLERTAGRVMASSSLHERFLVEGDDEIASLGQVFNRMLEALDKAHEAQMGEANRVIRYQSTLLSRITENTPDGFALIDCGSRMIMQANAPFFRILGPVTDGAGPGAPAPVRVPDLLGPIADTADRSPVPYSWQEELAFPGEAGAMTLARAQCILTRAEGGDRELVLFLTDITERKRARQALRESEERYRIFFESEESIRLIFDPATGAIKDANSAAVQFYGYSAQTLKSICIFDLNTLPRQTLLEKLRNLDQFDKGHFFFQHRVASGKIRDVEVYTALLRHGGTVQIMSSIHDVTELRRLERIKEDVERIVRHDLRSPLIGLINIPFLLQGDVNLTDRQRDLLGFVAAAGRKMLSQINSSLELHKIESGAYQFEPKPCNLVKLLRENADMLSLGAKRDPNLVRFRATGFEHGLILPSDPLLLDIIVMNLLRNALEASDKDETVFVDMSLADGELALQISNAQPVPLEIREKFFEKYSTAGKVGGTGLGTYSAFIMTKAIGGKLVMETSEKSGTSITIRLPATRAAASA